MEQNFVENCIQQGDDQYQNASTSTQQLASTSNLNQQLHPNPDVPSSQQTVPSVQLQSSGNVYSQCNFNTAGQDINVTGSAVQPPCTDVKSNINLLTLRELLKTSAENRCSSKNFLKLTRQKIEICPMEITDKPSRKVRTAEYATPRNRRKHAKSLKKWEEEGHYNRRKDYEEIDLKEKNKVPVESLFRLAEQQASKVGEPECQGNVVTLIGQPGIGKTTLSKVITENILQDKMENITNMNWVFYISVKNIDFQKYVTLVDFLLKYSLQNTSYNKLHGEGFSSLQEAILSKILESKNVFIAFDGLDEASTE
uniref:NACHT, LRR and PYD domains-containing protein 3-like n=1 Tax=Phallusia mammillata TaxID=59560 RepID=A0A6F9DMF8_9ASCI|nr:NACHT, LRR and PYD domains-containing protein 3-like [Phallusia mammillata]